MQKHNSFCLQHNLSLCLCLYGKQIRNKQTNKQTKKIRERLPVYEDKNELNEFEEKPINKDDDIENGMSCKRKKSLKKLKKVKGKDFFD